MSAKSEKLCGILKSNGHTNVRAWWCPITGGNDDPGTQSEGWMFESDQSHGEDTLGLNFESACLNAESCKP